MTWNVAFNTLYFLAWVLIIKMKYLKMQPNNLLLQLLLLHVQGHYWSEYITTILWPFALKIKLAQDRWNQLSMGFDEKTPNMKLSYMDSESWRLAGFHTFGCPCCVLDIGLQSDPKGIPKWEPHARIGIYLGNGRSPAHASKVALVFNPKTGRVSPHVNLVFDGDFTTVSHPTNRTVPPD